VLVVSGQPVKDVECPVQRSGTEETHLSTWFVVFVEIGRARPRGDMTVVPGSRDAEGDAGKRPIFGRSRGVAGGAWPHPSRSALLGPLGSRFWALAEEDSDAEEEAVAELEGRADPVGFSSPRFPPTQRTLGEEWCVVQPAGRRSSGTGPESVLVSGAAGAPPSEEISSDLHASAGLSDADFPPLGRSAIHVSSVASPQVLVGSVSILLQDSLPLAARRSLVVRRSPPLPGVGDEGDVALSQPRVFGGVDPSRQCLADPVLVQVRVVRGRPM
jgi:hypothetical protein